MSHCEACRKAETDRHSGLYISGCAQCDIRLTSKAPGWARNARYRQITNEARRELFIAKVESEFKRREALRK